MQVEYCFFDNVQGLSMHRKMLSGSGLTVLEKGSDIPSDIMGLIFFFSCRFKQLSLLSLLQEVCKFLKDPSLSDKLLLQNVFQAVNVYYNYSGEASCLDITETATKNLGQLGWYYQVCTLFLLNGDSMRFFGLELMRIVKSFNC